MPVSLPEHFADFAEARREGFLKVKELIKQDYMVSITLHSCDPFAIETENIRRVCEKNGIPLLHIETDFYPGDEGQIRTRIEAFLEMIRESKKEALHK